MRCEHDQVKSTAYDRKKRGDDHEGGPPRVSGVTIVGC